MRLYRSLVGFWSTLLAALVAVAFPVLAQQDNSENLASKNIQFTELIHAVREELSESREMMIENIKSGKRSGSLFKVKEFELELSFIVQKSKHGGTKIDLILITGEGNMSYQTEQI